MHKQSYSCFLIFVQLVRACVRVCFLYVIMFFILFIANSCSEKYTEVVLCMEFLFFLMESYPSMLRHQHSNWGSSKIPVWIRIMLNLDYTYIMTSPLWFEQHIPNRSFLTDKFYKQMDDQSSHIPWHYVSVYKRTGKYNYQFIWETSIFFHYFHIWWL